MGATSKLLELAFMPGSLIEETNLHLDNKILKESFKGDYTCEIYFAAVAISEFLRLEGYRNLFYLLPS